MRQRLMRFLSASLRFQRGARTVKVERSAASNTFTARSER